MAIPDETDTKELLALPMERAAKLAGGSTRQMRYWDETGLVVPSIRRKLDVRTIVRLYAFPDLVELLVVATMRRQGISLQHVRLIVDHLRTGGYGAPLRELRFAIYRGEVFFQHPDGSWEGGRAPRRIVLAHVIPLEEIATHIRQAVRREADAAGRVVRRHKVMGRQAVFEGTRIPLATVVGYLERGYTTEQILEAFPTLTAADVEAARHRGSVAQVRFILDENVDRAVGVVLRHAGHDCWPVGEAGLSGAIDDAIAVYADERKAVLVSHDRAR